MPVKPGHGSHKAATLYPFWGRYGAVRRAGALPELHGLPGEAPDTAPPGRQIDLLMFRPNKQNRGLSVARFSLG